ncbi:MAG: hypothetical protein ACK5P2_03675, partial [Pseudanabaena sp.]
YADGTKFSVFSLLMSSYLDVYLQDVAGGIIKSLESMAIDDVPTHLIPNVSNGRNKEMDDVSRN